MEPPSAAPSSRWNLALKGTLVVLALVLPGGSLLLLGVATWRGARKAARGGTGAGSLRSIVTGAVGSFRRSAPRSSAHQPGGLAA